MDKTIVTEINTIDPLSRQMEDDNLDFDSDSDSDSSIDAHMLAIRFSNISILTPNTHRVTVLPPY